MSCAATLRRKVYAMRLARKIQVRREGLAFEDEPFFFYLADEPVEVIFDPHGFARVTATFLAEVVEIDPTLATEATDDRTLVLQPH